MYFVQWGGFTKKFYTDNNSRQLAAGHFVVNNSRQLAAGHFVVNNSRQLATGYVVVKEVAQVVRLISYTSFTVAMIV